MTFFKSHVGVFYLLAAACLWSTIGPLSKLVFQANITPLETAFWRGALAGLCYLIHLAFISPKTDFFSFIGKFKSKEFRRLFFEITLFGVFGVALLEGSYVYAVHFGGAGLASVLLYSAPIWVNLYSWFFLKESIDPKQWLALSLTTIGIVGISLWGSHTFFSVEAILWGILSGLSYALFYIAGKRFFVKCNPIAVYALAFPVATVVLCPLVLNDSKTSLTEVFTRFCDLNSVVLIALISLGIVSTYVAYILHSKGLKLVAAGRSAIITSLEPVLSIFLSSIFWNESFSFTGYLCAGFVVLGIALSA